MLETSPITDIIDDQRPHRLAIVTKSPQKVLHSQSPILLLPRGVPNLRAYDFPLIQLYYLGGILQSNSGHDISGYFFLAKGVQNMRLASIGIPNQDDCMIMLLYFYRFS